MNQRKAGAMLSYIYLIVHSITTFIYTPFLLKYLGQSEYGLYALSISIMSYLTMLDLGFGNAMVKFVSKFKALKKPKEEHLINGLFMVFYTVIGIITIFLGFILYKNVNLIFGAKFTISELKTFKVLLIILTLNVATAFPLSIFGSYIISYEKFIFQKVVLLIRTIIYPILLILALTNGAKSIATLLVISILNLLMNLSNMVYCIRKLSFKMKINKECFKYVKEVFSYSFFIFLIVIVDNVYNNTDQIILGAYCGTIAVAVYGLAIQIKTMYDQMSTSISGVLFPKVVGMIETKQDKEVSIFFNRISKIQMIVMFLILFGFITYGMPFISLWGGKDYSDAYWILLVLMIPSVVPLTQNTALSIIQAKNKHKFRAIIYLCIAILNIIITIPLSKAFNGLGAAIGSSIALFLGNILIMNIYYVKKIKLDLKTYWKNFATISIIEIVQSTIFIIISKFIPITNLLLLLVFALIYTIVYFILIYLFFISKDDQRNARNRLKEIIYKVFTKTIIKKCIIFESGPDMSGNTLSVYEELLRRKLNKKYKFVWFVDDPKLFEHLKNKNIKFAVKRPKDIFNKIKTLYYNFFAIVIIDSNSFVYKKHNLQKRIYLSHGMGYKNVLNYLKDCGQIDYVLTCCSVFDDFYMKNFCVKNDQLIELGFPRNDIFLNNKKINLKQKLKLSNESKVIMWLPTYRKHKDLDFECIPTKKDDFGIPIFKTEEELLNINKLLEELNIYIYMKLHPAQDVEVIKNINLSNIKIITDKDLEKLNISLYEFLKETDSLITDYSSVYIDYLLTNNVIGVTLDDIEEVNKENALFIQNYEEIIGGVHLKTYKDFENYIKNIGKYKKTIMNEELKKYHSNIDDKSTKRVSDFIEKFL